jgi:CheY-like chemotaxis protein
MNLCVNATHAMANHKGHIAVEIGVCDINGSKPAAGLQSGRYVVLRVRDDGSGMTAETLEHLFEPFYTTKPLGEGSGLGLAVAHGIVHAHSGAIAVHSELGRGTTFEVYLPALPPDTRVDTLKRTHDQLAIRGSGQRIIYIDDEAPLVFLAQRLFERLGYKAEGFTDASVAIEAFRANPAAYDLVVTDLSMPDMSGIEVAKALFAIDSTARVILASGYVRPTDVEQAHSLGIHDVILKPSTIEELAIIVQRVLGKPKHALGMKK